MVKIYIVATLRWPQSKPDGPLILVTPENDVDQKTSTTPHAFVARAHWLDLVEYRRWSLSSDFGGQIHHSNPFQ
jgi:hypothetical protein